MAIVGYNIYRNGVKQNTELIETTQYLITGLTTNTNIGDVTVKSVDNQGRESQSALQIPSFLTKPAQVQNLNVSVSGSSQMNLSWDVVDGDGDVEYNIYRGITSGGLTPVDVGRLVPSFVDSANPNTRYFYAIEAENATGKGGLSVEVSGITEQSPPTAFFELIPQNPLVDEEVQFTSSVTNTNTYAWDFGDSTNSTLANPTKTYNVAGEYTVILTVMGDGGTAEFQRVINVSEVLTDSLPYVTNFQITNNGGVLESNFEYNSDTGVLENNEPPVVTNVEFTGQFFVGEILTVSYDIFSPRGYTLNPANDIIRVYRVVENEENQLVATLNGNEYVITTEDVGSSLIASVSGSQTSVPPQNGNPLSIEVFSQETDIVQTEFNVDVLFNLYYRNENIGLTWINSGFDGEDLNAVASTGNEPSIDLVNNRINFANNKWFTFKTPGNTNGVPYVTVMRFSKSIDTNMRLLELGVNHNTEFRAGGTIRLDNSTNIETTSTINNDTDYIMIIQYLMNNTFDIIVSVYLGSNANLVFEETITGGDKAPRGLQGSIGSDFGSVPFTGWVKEFGIKIGTINSFDKENIINRLVSIS